MERDDSPYRTFRDGDRVCMSLCWEDEEGSPICITSCMSLEATKKALLASKALKGEKLAPLYIEEMAYYLITKKLKTDVDGKMDRAISQSPAVFMGADADYMKALGQGLDVAINVVSDIYPGVGAAMKTISAANKGDPQAKRDIAETHQAAREGDPQAQKDASDLQKAMDLIKKVAGGDDTKYSREIKVAREQPKSGSWYEEGLR